MMSNNIQSLHENLKSYIFTNEEMAKYFLLDDYDKFIIFKRKEPHNQVGFAVQLCTVRFIGTFLLNPIEVPDKMLDYISNQLEIDKNFLNLYKIKKTYQSHRTEIKEVYEYHDFSEKEYNKELLNWLTNYIWLTNDNSKIILKKLMKKCIDNKIILPGITTLDKFISTAFANSDKRLWDALISLPDSIQCKALEGLLKTYDNSPISKFELLKNPVTSESPRKFLAAIKRYGDFCSFGSEKWDISDIPPNKIQALAKYAAATKTQLLERMSYKKRISILSAFIIVYTIRSRDDVIDYMIHYFSGIFARAVKKTEKARLRTIKDLDRSARELSKICSMLLNDEISDEMLRTVIFSNTSKENLTSIINEVNTLTKPAGQNVDFSELFRYYKSIRIFMPKLLETIKFKASAAGESTLVAWEFLADAEFKTNKNKFEMAPTSEITPVWKKVIFKNGKIQPCAYTFWTIENMLKGIKNRDIYFENSEKYNDPKSRLIKLEDWSKKSQDFIETFEWPLDSKEAVSFLKKELEDAYSRTEKNWDQNPYARIDKPKNKIILTPLEKIEESLSLKRLKKQIDFLMPNISLPDLLFETNSKTGFLGQFCHISQSTSKIKDLPVSLCAILVAKACNIGFSSVAQAGIAPLEYDRLMWVWHNYFSAENIQRANSILIEYMSTLSLASIWGTGEVASADGIRYVVPQKTIYASHNPKYFGLKRGITCYELINDQFVSLNRTVITGTLRDSLYLLDLVLGQKSEVQPKEIMTDTAGYSNIVFGLFALLGYQFSPRIADIGGSRFWRFDYDTDYGVLNDLAKNKLRENLIHKYRDDMLRVSASLKFGNVTALNLVQMLQHSGKQTMLGRAIGEFGRVFKTIYQLTYIDDPNYRRRILIQLNRGECENSLKRVVTYGKKGQILKPYKDDQDEQMNILALVVNSIIIWNTLYMELALNFIRELGEPVKTEDIEHTSPLGFEHINILGKYNFEISPEVMSGKYRSLKKVDLDSFLKL